MVKQNRGDAPLITLAAVAVAATVGIAWVTRVPTRSSAEPAVNARAVGSKGGAADFEPLPESAGVRVLDPFDAAQSKRADEILGRTIDALLSDHPEIKISRRSVVSPVYDAGAASPVGAAIDVFFEHPVSIRMNLYRTLVSEDGQTTLQALPSDVEGLRGLMIIVSFETGEVTGMYPGSSPDGREAVVRPVNPERYRTHPDDEGEDE